MRKEHYKTPRPDLSTPAGSAPHPRPFSDLEDRGADRLGQLVANREADPGIAAVGGERVRLTADIGADQDLSVNVLGRELLEREPQHREVIRGGIRSGIPRRRIAAFRRPPAALAARAPAATSVEKPAPSSTARSGDKWRSWRANVSVNTLIEAIAEVVWAGWETRLPCRRHVMRRQRRPMWTDEMRRTTSLRTIPFPWCLRRWLLVWLCGYEIPASAKIDCQIRTNCVVLAGRSLPDRSVLATCSVLRDMQSEKGRIYAGAPARSVKKLPPDVGFSPRELGALAVGEVLGVLPDREAGAFELTGEPQVALAPASFQTSRQISSKAAVASCTTWNGSTHRSVWGARSAIGLLIQPAMSADQLELLAALGAVRVEVRQRRGAIAAGRGPHQSTGVMVDHDGHVALALAVADLVDPIRRSPSSRWISRRALAATRSRIWPTVRHAFRISSATAVFEQ